MTMRLDVWSDYVCPFCYLEEPVLERVRQEYGETLDVVWRAFELRPEPQPTLDPDGEYLHSIWQSSVYPMARQRGMVLRLPPVQPRSRRAFELAELARERGCFGQVNHAIFRAFFEEGRDLDHLPVLVEIGSGAGLDPVEVRDALEQNRFTGKVLADELEAKELGISGVPALVIRPDGESFADAASLSGAQPFELVKATIEGLKQTPG